MLPVQNSTRRHILTVNLEDYFQVGAFNKYVQKGQWYRFESRLEHHTDKALELLSRHNTKATFFVLGWVADHYPELVKRIADRGHEVASRGYFHRNIRDLSPEEFRDDLHRAKAAIERASEKKVVGFRTADGWFRPQDMWALDVLAAEGYAYDSSVGPMFRRFAGESWRRFSHIQPTAKGTITVLPISSMRCAGFDLPIGGGNWIRQLPDGFMRRAIQRWDEKATAPLVMYFHTWELDREQPRISTAGWMTKIRQYRNIDLMEERLGEYLAKYHFSSAAEYLGVATPPVFRPLSDVETPPPSFRKTEAYSKAGIRPPVSIVVPVYNEEKLVPYMANVLKNVRDAFAERYDLRFLLVDDGSKDQTCEKLVASFGQSPDVKILSHEVNRGVAAAIMTGIRAADTEIVCSIDADCSYDPLELLNMIPKLVGNVDMVTASPYHADGHVRNVPRWRLFLSKSASRMYRHVMHNQLQTYTSCFRVYRRSAVKDIVLRSGNFLGVVELLGQLDQRGGRVVEHPTTLEVRMLGRSKMKTVRTIFGHLRMMARFTFTRLTAHDSRHNTEERNRTLSLLFDTATATTCHAALGKPANTATVPK